MIIWVLGSSENRGYRNLRIFKQKCFSVIPQTVGTNEVTKMNGFHCDKTHIKKKKIEKAS